jgi:hypothetical protein
MVAEVPQQEKDNITNINVSRLPTNLYKTAQAISLLCGYDNVEDYLLELIRADIKMELDGSGRLALTMLDDDVKKMLLGEDLR